MKLRDQEGKRWEGSTRREGGDEIGKSGRERGLESGEGDGRDRMGSCAPVFSASCRICPWTLYAGHCLNCDLLAANSMNTVARCLLSLTLFGDAFGRILVPFLSRYSLYSRDGSGLYSHRSDLEHIDSSHQKCK